MPNAFAKQGKIGNTASIFYPDLFENLRVSS